MPPEPETLRGVLYLIVCGAPPARDANRLVQLAQAEGRLQAAHLVLEADFGRDEEPEAPRRTAVIAMIGARACRIPAFRPYETPCLGSNR